MAIEHPLATDKLNAPSHSKMHRIVATDSAAPEDSIVVQSNGDVDIAGELRQNGITITESALLSALIFA